MKERKEQKEKKTNYNNLTVLIKCCDLTGEVAGIFFSFLRMFSFAVRNILFSSVNKIFFFLKLINFFDISWNIKFFSFVCKVCKY